MPKVDERRPRRRRPRPPAPPGFTLVELLVVLAILGLLAAVAGPQVLRELSGAKGDTARVQLESLSTSIDLYRLEVGEFPPDLEALVSRPPGAEKWNGPYLKKRRVPLDPWGHEYVYRMPGEFGPYDVLTLGADNAEGGEGEDRDLSNWE